MHLFYKQNKVIADNFRFSQNTLILTEILSIKI